MLLESTVAFVILSTALTSSSMPMPISPNQVGIASRFGDPNDKWVGGNLYCNSKRRVNSKEHVCAHRYAGYKGLPCGSILIIENPRTKKRSWCRVMDRGPYGANVLSRSSKDEKYTYALRPDGRKHWYVKINKDHKPPASKCPHEDCVGRWIGILDLSPAVSDDLGHNGMERVKVWTLTRLIRYLDLQRKKIEKIEQRKNSV
jgi:hypothetical protein